MAKSTSSRSKSASIIRTINYSLHVLEGASAQSAESVVFANSKNHITQNFHLIRLVTRVLELQKQFSESFLYLERYFSLRDTFD